MKHRQPKDKQPPKQDGYSKLLRGIAKREKLRRLQEGCPPMHDVISRRERMVDFLMRTEKLPEAAARVAAQRAIDGEGREPARQPAAEPRIDARKLSQAAYQEYLGRKYGLALDATLPGSQDNIATRALRRAEGGEVDLPAGVRASLDREAAEKAERRKAEIEKGSVNLKHADPAIVTARLRALGADAVVVSGIRRHDLAEGLASHHDASYGERIKLWRATYEAARAAGRSDVDAKAAADRAAPPPGTPMPTQPKRRGPHSPNDNKLPPEPKTNARGMSAAQWQEYLRGRGLSMPVP